MHLFVEQFGNIHDFVVVLAERLVGAAKAVENAQLSKSDVHAFQVAHVANVLVSPDADDRKNPKAVRVIEHGGQIIGHLQISVIGARTAGNDGNRILVDLFISVDADADAHFSIT